MGVETKMRVLLSASKIKCLIYFRDLGVQLNSAVGLEVQARPSA